MATIKSFTSLEQSRKLAEILPIESADMYFEKGIGDNYKVSFGNYVDMQIAENMLGIKTIPCWSLSALLDVLPNASILLKGFDKIYDLTNSSGEIAKAENPVDACVAMIEKLNELNLL